MDLLRMTAVVALCAIASVTVVKATNDVNEHSRLLAYSNNEAEYDYDYEEDRARKKRHSLWRQGYGKATLAAAVLLAALALAVS